jgi:outer membrane protein assembly factor BamA
VNRQCTTRRGVRAGGSPRPAVSAAAALLLLCALPLPAQAQRELGPEIRSMRFVGATAFDSRTLAAGILTRASRCRSGLAQPACVLGYARDTFHLDDDLLRADILRLRLFYYQRGYREAAVEAVAEPVRHGVRVTFHIEEGAPVRISGLGFEAPADLDLARFIAGLPVASGRPFNTVVYEAARDTLANRLRNRGYPQAQVLTSYLIPSDSPYTAHVEYQLLPGELLRFGEIRVLGNAAVQPSVVRRRLTFREGDVYSQDEMLRSQRNLFGTRVFRHVDIRTDPDGASAGRVPVTVSVSEGDMHRVRLGVGMNSADALNAEGRWVSRNFLGGTRRLEASGRVNNVLSGPLGRVPFFDTGSGRYGEIAGGVALDFSQPWFLGPRNTGGAGLFVDRRSVPEVFVRTTYGGYLSFGRLLDERTSAVLSYRPELTRLEAEGDLLFCVSFVACAFEDLQILKQPHWLVPLGLFVVRDHTNAILAPTSGSILRVEAEVAHRIIGSEFEHVRILAEGSLYEQVAPGVVLAARLRPGFAVPFGEPGDSGSLGLHPQKRFFAGGSNSVRGFPQYQLGPKVLTVDAAGVLAQPVSEGGAGCTPEAINDGSCDAGLLGPRAFRARPVGGAVLLEGNIELRFPLWGDKIRGATFLDIGQVWPAEREVRIRDLAWSPGVGVRYFSPIGPIRVDIGYHPATGETLPVLTTEVCRETATGECVAPHLAPEGRLVNRPNISLLAQPVFWRTRESFLERFQIHLSIGQAF